MTDPNRPDMDRSVGGIRCREVLARLSDYLDDELGETERARVETHLRGCAWCESFGGRFAETVARLRRELAAAEALPPEIEARLKARLDEG